MTVGDNEWLINDDVLSSSLLFFFITLANAIFKFINVLRFNTDSNNKEK